MPDPIRTIEALTSPGHSSRWAYSVLLTGALGIGGLRASYGIADLAREIERLDGKAGISEPPTGPADAPARLFAGGQLTWPVPAYAEHPALVGVARPVPPRRGWADEVRIDALVDALARAHRAGLGVHLPSAANTLLAGIVGPRRIDLRADMSVGQPAAISLMEMGVDAAVDRVMALVQSWVEPTDVGAPPPPLFACQVLDCEHTFGSEYERAMHYQDPRSHGPEPTTPASLGLVQDDAGIWRMLAPAGRR